MIVKVFSSLTPKFSNEDFLSQRTFLKTRHKRFSSLNECVGSSVPKAVHKFNSTDSFDETKVSELNEPVELLILIGGAA